MGFRIGSLLLLAALATLFAACGGGGGAPVDPNAVAIVTVDLSKTLALADNTDTVSITATVTKNAGGAVADGTVVTFSVPAGTGTLSANTATTTGGTTAPITLKRAALTGGAVNQTIVVTASAGGVSDTASVKFINQPTSAVVQIALNRSITNLGSLQFGILNTAGASFTINAGNGVAIGTAAGSSYTEVGYINNVAIVGLINAVGFTTGINPILQLTYNVTPVVPTGLPNFSIDSGTLINATDPALAPIVPALTVADFVLTRTFNTE